MRKGTRKTQCTDFQTYVKDSLLRYDLTPKTSVNFTGESQAAFIMRYSRFLEGLDNSTEILMCQDDAIERDKLEKDIARVWKRQNKRLKAVEIYTGLQMMLQLPAESLVLQDRLCWLHEQGLEAVIVPVMNKRLSPRSHAIVSRKR